MMIDNGLYEELLDLNAKQLQVMNKLIVNLKEQKHERWCDTGMAERETGIPSARIRYLARSNQIQSKRTGQRKMSVRLKDLESFSK